MLASLLELDHEWIQVNPLAGEMRTAELLSTNPNGKIPLLELDDGRFLSESNAILNCLAAGSEVLSAVAFAKAKVATAVFEQYSHAPYIAVAHTLAKSLGLPAAGKAEDESRQKGGYKALGVMETQWAKTPLLSGARVTVADVALYGDTHVAHEGGFDLSGYPALRARLDRVAAHPKYAGIG